MDKIVIRWDGERCANCNELKEFDDDYPWCCEACEKEYWEVSYDEAV